MERVSELSIDTRYPTRGVGTKKRTDLFVDLLVEMAVFLGYNFNRVEISREVYWPSGHARIEADQQIIREGMAKLFRGEFSIPVDVKAFPAEARALEEQEDLRRLLLKWLRGEQSVKVDLNSPSSKRQSALPT